MSPWTITGKWMVNKLIESNLGTFLISNSDNVFLNSPIVFCALVFSNFTHTIQGVVAIQGIHPKRISKFKSREISFVHKFNFSRQISSSDFCREHGSITVLICAKCQNNWASTKYVMGKRYFAKFEFKMSFRGITSRGPAKSYTMRY